MFGLRANVPDVDGARITADSDGIRIGSSRILTLGPGRHGDLRHAVSARPARSVRGARARCHRTNARVQVRRGDGAMEHAVEERRAEPRLAAAALQIERATLRPGCLVAVLDLSANGAQVQSERPLRPGSRVHVRLAARNWTLAVAADVVRCSVWIVQADAVIYRGALRFEEECASFWEEQAASATPS